VTLKSKGSNPRTYLTCVFSLVRDKRITLLTPDEFHGSNLTQFE